MPPLAITTFSRDAAETQVTLLATLAEKQLAASEASLSTHAEALIRGLNETAAAQADTDRVRTTATGTAAKTGRTLDEVLAQRRGTIPARRFGSADEFGAFCAFMCSAQAGYLTGQNILLDGGAYPGTF